MLTFKSFLESFPNKHSNFQAMLKGIEADKYSVPEGAYKLAELSIPLLNKPKINPIPQTTHSMGVRRR